MTMRNEELLTHLDRCERLRQLAKWESIALALTCNSAAMPCGCQWLMVMYVACAEATTVESVHRQPLLARQKPATQHAVRSIVVIT